MRPRLSAPRLHDTARAARSLISTVGLPARSLCTDPAPAPHGSLSHFFWPLLVLPTMGSARFFSCASNSLHSHKVRAPVTERLGPALALPGSRSLLRYASFVEAPRARRRHRVRHRLTRVPGRVVRRQRVGPDGLLAVESGAGPAPWRRGWPRRRATAPELLSLAQSDATPHTSLFGTPSVPVQLI